MVWDWNNIRECMPAAAYVTVDANGMACIHATEPTFFPASGRWQSPTRQSYYLTDITGIVDFPAASRLFSVPGEATHSAPHLLALTGNETALEDRGMAPTGRIEGPDAPADKLHPLAALRKKHGMTQRQLSDALGCVPNYISLIETRRPLSLGMARKIAKHFTLTLDEVLSW